MKRRAHLAATLVALLVVGTSIATTTPRDLARAADPATELADTQARLAEAESRQDALQRSVQDQRAKLAQLENQSVQLSAAFDAARTELESVTAEYDRVYGLLVQVQQQVDEITAQLAALREQIAALDDELITVASEINRRSRELDVREGLLQDHLRAAYERSQTSVLEVILSADSLDTASNEVGYLLTVSDQDTALAEQIRTIREELDTRRETLQDGRRALADARGAAREQEDVLVARQTELSGMEAQLAELKVLADQKQAAQEQALNASLAAEDDVEAQIAEGEAAARAAQDLANRLLSQAASQQAAIDEAKRQAEAAARLRAEEEARRQAEAAARQAAAPPPPAPPAISNYGFRWPEASTSVTQEWGPTNFQLEPPYTYGGIYYANFHAGIDMANGCGTPLLAVGPGVVVASGQPLMPWDTGYGVVIDHGDGIQSWYWHMQPRVVVQPGQIVIPGTVIGYEGSTGNSTGCHVHFAINDRGVWENPRFYLP